MSDLAQLEAQKRKLISQVDGWSLARISCRPSPGAWSAAEVFDHLVRTEEEILASAKQHLTAPHHIGVRDRLGTLFIHKVFQTERRVKVPVSTPQVLPEPSPDLGLVFGRWQRTRRDFAEFGNQLSSDQARIGLVRHPVCGWMGVPQVIAFFFVHMVHHGYQISRLGSASQGLE